MKRFFIATFLGLSLGVISLASAETELVLCGFESTLICHAGAPTCQQHSNSTITSLVFSYPVRAGSDLKICFANWEQCISTNASIRSSVEGDMISIGILQNPKGLGGYPKKIFASFTFSQFERLPSQLILYFEATPNIPPSTHLITGQCSVAEKGRGKHKLKD